MRRQKINSVLQSDVSIENLLVKGWMRTRRDSKGFSFIEINDGSCLSNLQVIAGESLKNYNDIKMLTTGSAVAVTGKLSDSPGKGQKWELLADSIEIINRAPENYPLQKKRHSDEFLRTIAHLRPRTNKYGAAFRIRSELSFAIHQFFRNKGFIYVHTPILTGLDCEGAGDLFSATCLNFENMPELKNTSDYSNDFFGKKAYLTVSGQLSAEMFALSLGDVYTFGPTFRAENSNTRRHAAEFWMVEPESAFCNLFENMDLAENLITSLIRHVLENCEEDISLFARYVDKGLMSKLCSVISEPFIRIPYEDVVSIISKSNHPFEYDLCFGKSLQAEHERYLTEKHFKKPVIVYDYPKEATPFYMRLNGDNRTVAGMDVLVPMIGEIIGGSQREERLEILLSRMKNMGLNQEDYWWYLESRKFGSVPHSGFGLGFERLLMFITGISNIRDVIPFPRTPRNIDF